MTYLSHLDHLISGLSIIVMAHRPFRLLAITFALLATTSESFTAVSPCPPFIMGPVFHYGDDSSLLSSTSRLLFSSSRLIAPSYPLVNVGALHYPLWHRRVVSYFASPSLLFSSKVFYFVEEFLKDYCLLLEIITDCDLF